MNNIYSNKIAQIKANLKAQLEAKAQQEALVNEVWGQYNEADEQSDQAIDRLIAGIEAQSDEFYFG